MKIEHLIIIHGAILIVYYTSHQGYQYEIAVGVFLTTTTNNNNKHDEQLNISFLFDVDK